VLGVIVGGRLGYVLFYAPSHFLHNPLDIFKVWQGGMSFHGGTLGVIAAITWCGWRNKVNLADLADRLVPAIPIGLFLGRVANFVNGELIGRPAPETLPWSMVFPQIDTLPRHPSQLYEAALEGLLLGLLLWLATRKGITRWQPSGIFLSGYALARILVENFRTPEITHNLGLITLTQGQLLSLPMLAAGLALLAIAGPTRTR
jgi:phosphatidylglycerol:prolipoprotein diacylglycerol transferase